MQKYIGKSIKTNQWVKSNNILVDPKNNDTYLIPDLFSLDNLSLDKRSLVKYKVDNKSVGIAIAKDINYETIYSGDRVEIAYYNLKSPARKKIISIVTVCYDGESKLYYMQSDEKKVFLFKGDSYHLISSIKRIGRKYDLLNNKS